MMDVEYLFKLRLVVARVGEQDAARWWNTTGQLGALGASVLRRGFPKTYRFAQARSVFAVAQARSNGLFSSPASVTLWGLPAELEDEFEARWSTWIDQAASWEPFFVELESCSADLMSELQRMGLLSDAQVRRMSAIRPVPGRPSVDVGRTFSASRDDFAALAAGWSLGAVGEPVVPFQARGGAAWL